MMYKSEKYKAYKLDEVRDDGAEWIRKTLGLAKADHMLTRVELRVSLVKEKY